MLSKYLSSLKDKIRLFKYNFERIVLFQISLGIVLGVLLGSSKSILVIIAVLIISLPLKRLKLVFYFSLILGFIYFSQWETTMDKEIDVVTHSQIELTARVININNGELNKTLTLELEGYKGKALADVGLYSEIDLYDEVNIKGSFNLPKSFSDFDYSTYLKSNKIFYEFKGSADLIKKERNILTFLRDFKYKLMNLTEKNISLPYSALLNGILLGDTSKIPDDVNEAFRATGTSHILSVSGFNFTIILVALLSMSSIFGRRTLLLVSIPSILLFLLLIGINNVTAVRATIMILIYIVANLLGRKINFLYLVSLTLMIFLLDYPLAWTNVSLQLSFGSLLGLFFLSKSFNSFFKKFKLPENIVEVLSASLAAILGTLPFTINTFGTLSLVAPITNIFVLPFIPFVMLLGFIGEILGLLQINELASLFLKISELILKFVNEVIVWFSKLSFANTSNSIVILFAALILISIFIYSDFKNFYKKYY